MIPHAAPRGQTIPTVRDWQQSLSDLVTEPAELIRLLGLDPALIDDARFASHSFRLKVPREFVRRMTPGDPADPLLRQVLPIGAEMQLVPGFSGDPLDEAVYRRAPGLLQKYRGRVLVILGGACAINCRYCFRRHFPYEENTPDTARWEQILATIADDDSVEEVILSGGDPLLASNRRLAWIVKGLESIPHLQRLRVHTRLPVVIPSRVDAELPAILASGRLASLVVIHANHAQELDDEVAGAMSRLTEVGIHLLNQSVLLKGINDSVEALTALSHRLLACRVLPYYLHLLDPVAGAAHFDLDEDTATRLIRELSARVPGYLVPRLVREVPGDSAKTPVVLRG